MRCGCIANDGVQCDDCHRILQYGERYLAFDGDSGEIQRFCVECCLSRDYATYKTEKEEQVITFFPPDKMP